MVVGFCFSYWISYLDLPCREQYGPDPMWGTVVHKTAFAQGISFNFLFPFNCHKLLITDLGIQKRKTHLEKGKYLPSFSCLSLSQHTSRANILVPSPWFRPMWGEGGHRSRDGFRVASFLPLLVLYSSSVVPSLCMSSASEWAFRGVHALVCRLLPQALQTLLPS